MNRARGKWLGWAAAALVVIAVVAFRWWRSRPQPARLVTAPVTIGSITKSVSATGTVNPVVTVQVGTYVSGPITRLYVDFNSPVKARELMAKIDPRPFEAQVALARAALADSRAQLEKDTANLAYHKLTYARDVQLGHSAVISKDQVDNELNLYRQAKAQVDLDRADIQQKEASLKQAQLNLNYTNIVSPVDGTVVSRNIDVGQTVAASFQTPTLFLVAKDLTKMEVDTTVSESDIGNVRKGETADFTVDAYPGRIFKGVVAQVRQAPITVQNVVTYDVVVDVSNPELRLKPGMTANVTVITDRVNHVIRVPLQALHFSPSGFSRASTQIDPGGNHATVWVDSSGKLRRTSIIKGVDDGNHVQVVNGNLHPGELVVTNEIRPTQKRARSPFGFRPR